MSDDTLEPNNETEVENTISRRTFIKKGGVLLGGLVAVGAVGAFVGKELEPHKNGKPFPQQARGYGHSVYGKGKDGRSTFAKS
jgi:hypothetical protein